MADPYTFVMADLIGHLNRAAEALGAVLEDLESIAVGDGTDGGIVGREAEKVHGNDHFGSQTSFGENSLNGPFQVFRIQIEGFFLHVHEHRRRPFQGNDLRRGEEGEVRHEHRVPGADAPGLQSQGQGIRSVRAGEAMLHAYILCQLFFQLPHLRSHDIGSGRHRLQYCLVHILLQDTVLLFQIPEFHP